MSKKILYLVILIVLVGGTAAFLAATQSTNNLNNLNSNADNVFNPQPENPDQTGIHIQNSQNNENGGEYVDYDESAIKNASGQRVLFFHAPWCPQCRAIEKDVIKQGVPEGFTVIKVDYDSRQDLRQKYGVTLQTTFVKVDENGKFISKYVAYNEPTLEALKRDFL